MPIVLSAFNEEHRIGATLEKLIACRSTCEHELEGLLVDDGSTDATAAVVRTFADTLPELKILSLDVNSGKGRA